MNRADSKRVLVVDDELHLCEIIAYDLQKVGYAVSRAGSGNEAFKMVKGEHFDLVISDVRMPSGTGLELLDWIRAEKPNEPPFVFMTAFADVSSPEALDLGAEDFLRKPIEKTELLEVVKKAMVPRQERWAIPADYESVRTFALDPGPWADISEELEPKPIVTIGQGGMFMAMDEGWPTCYEVVGFNVAFKPAKSGRLLGQGRVRWVRHQPEGGLPAGIGLEFTALEPESLDNVMDYLKQTKPRSYIPLGPA